MSFLPKSLFALLLATPALALPHQQQLPLSAPRTPIPASSCECRLSSPSSPILFTAPLFISQYTDQCTQLANQLTLYRAHDPEYWTALLSYVSHPNAQTVLPNREDEDESAMSLARVVAAEAVEKRGASIEEVRAMRIRELTASGEDSVRVVCKLRSEGSEEGVEVEDDDELDVEAGNVLNSLIGGLTVSKMREYEDIRSSWSRESEELEHSLRQPWVMDEGMFWMACGVVMLLLAMVAEICERVNERCFPNSRLLFWRKGGESGAVFLEGDEKKLYAEYAYATTATHISLPVVVVTRVDEDDCEMEDRVL